MKRTSYALAGLGLVALGLAGCEIVLGLDEREVYKADASIDVSAQGGSEGDSGPDVIEEPAPTECVFPEQKVAGKSAATRIGSFLTSVMRVDFCMKPHDAASWTGVIPTMRSWGDLCPAGLAYRDVTGQFYMAGGNYDIKLVAAGETCESEGLASLDQVTIEDGKDNDIFAFGDGSTNVVKKFQETRGGVVSSFNVRFIHAANGKGAYDFGLADPAQDYNLYVPFFLNVGFGTTAKAGTVGLLKTDANGYTQPQIPGGTLGFGAAPTGTTLADLFRFSPVKNGQSYTVFATGTEGSKDFPPQLWTCNEGTSSKSNGISYATCGDGTPKDIAVDTINTQLNGAYAGYESERRQPLIDALSGLTSDVLCVTEIWSDADKQALADKAKTMGWEYSFYAKHDWNTPVDDPTDQNGNVPPEYATAPCAASIDKMNTALNCLRDTCMGGDENAKPDAKYRDCVMGCANKGLLALITGSDDDKTCWSCIFTQSASYETTAWTRDKCATDPKARYVFRGADGAMLLSKHPFKKDENQKDLTEAWVLPATEWRVSVLRAPIETADTKASADVYCTVLTTPATSCITRPYTGQYGGSSGGMLDCTKQWQAELDLQTAKLINYVNKSSTDKHERAIITGEFYSGAGYTKEGIDVLTEQYPDSYAKLLNAFALAQPVGYTPQCTYCPADNAIITPPGTPTTANSTWTSNIFMAGIPITLVQSSDTILKDPTIDVGLKDSDGGSILIPVSPYFGYRSVIRLYP